MDKLNFINIIKSFFLGAFIGFILQFRVYTDQELAYRAMAVLASGSIGFLIGLVTEWLTAILPISLARVRTYFLINGLLALVVTSILMLVLDGIAGSSTMQQLPFAPALGFVLAIVAIANLLDYSLYRRTQRRLERYKRGLRGE